MPSPTPILEFLAELDVDGPKAPVTLEVDGTKDMGGSITIGPRAFVLKAPSDLSRFIATYHNDGGEEIDIHDLAQAISSDLAKRVPPGLTIRLEDVLFAYQGGVLFGLDLGADFNLSNLPLVGKTFPKDQTLAVNDLQILAASAPFTDVEALNALLPEGVTPLPAGGAQKGLTVAATMQFGAEHQTLALNVGGDDDDPSTLGAAAASDHVKWFKLQKTFGPVYFDKVGARYQQQKGGAVLWFLLDASFTLAGLTLSLDGLAFGSPLKTFAPTFALDGLGLDLRRGPLEIGGAFLRTTVGGVDEYDGAALFKTEQLSLAALGSYAFYDGQPSLFVYAALDEPLGGPPFFFVEGLAAGFGYNRALTVPPLGQLAGFPLVAAAVGGSGTPNDEITNLSQSVPLAVGEDFLAVGVKFTTFKMIDSFALVTAQFGTRFELDVLGLSTVVVPTPVDGESASPPLAEVQLALRASFIPDEGLLAVSGQLTPASFILSRACHLTGGFAFYSWFAGPYAGDFVFTIGGYHPAFAVPTHYPRVPRLAFNWQVDPNITIKGSAYCALIPHTLMAGGYLEALWHSGPLQAWFKASADFQIDWQPYHYDAQLHVDVGVQYTYHFFGTHHITADVGADLHLWGPAFSGTAHVSLWIVSFTVSFGGASPHPGSIDWPTFKRSFLPADDAVCGITVKSGLLKTVTVNEEKQWIVNPKDLALVTNSVIPSNKTTGGLPTGKAKFDFGIAPMDVPDVTTTLTITVTQDGTAAEGDFKFTPILKNVPAGMWGTKLSPDLNGQTLIADTLAGFEIIPAKQPAPGETQAIPRQNLQYETTPIPDAFAWESLQPFTAQTTDDAAGTIDTSILSTEETRNALLNALGLDTTTILLTQDSQHPNRWIGNDFIVAPQIQSQP